MSPHHPNVSAAPVCHAARVTYQHHPRWHPTITARRRQPEPMSNELSKWTDTRSEPRRSSRIFVRASRQVTAVTIEVEIAEHDRRQCDRWTMHTEHFESEVVMEVSVPASR
jgi:hypothetical protein